MGAWGAGPFDSDGALDYLGDLAHTAATVDGEGGIVPGTVDVPRVAAALRETLSGAASCESWQCDAVFAACGLIAAFLSDPAPAAQSTGTRLIASFDGDVGGLGLESHCGYLGLLNRDAARTLLPEAVAAMAALRGHRDWLSTWFDDEIERTLASLHQLLIDQAPDAA